MLLQLNIKDLAIIETLSIRFSPNFNVVTGETGAGKSIIIKALSLLLGLKGTARDLRDGASKASLFGEFRVRKGHACLGILDELAIPYEPDGDFFIILIRRILHRGGRSAVWVCDVPVTLTSLRAIGYLLVDICGQHDNQKILNAKEQGKILDEFLTQKSLLQKVSTHFDEAVKIHGKLKSFVEDFQSRVRERDYWEFRRDELSALNPDADEYEELTNLCDQTKQRVQDGLKLQAAIEILDTAYGGGSLSEALWSAHQNLSETKDEKMGFLCSELEKLATELDEISFRANGFMAANEDEEALGRKAMERLSLYQEMFRKLGVKDIKDLLIETQKVYDKIAFLEGAGEAAQDLLKSYQQATDKLEKAAGLLTKERRKAAKIVEKDVKKELAELNMTGSFMEIQLKPIQKELASLEADLLELVGESQATAYRKAREANSGLSASGSESPRFLFASAPGAQPKPLEKVASGGEVSRIMLALKRALAAGAETCVLVFDEIDAGISGKVADLVGRKLHTLGRTFQVLCVSHLAQVAAYADHHFVVRKGLVKGKMETSIKELSESGKKEEVARLLSGEEVTPASLSNAKSMVARAHKLSAALGG